MLTRRSLMQRVLGAMAGTVLARSAGLIHLPAEPVGAFELNADVEVVIRSAYNEPDGLITVVEEELLKNGERRFRSKRTFDPNLFFQNSVIGYQ